MTPTLPPPDGKPWCVSSVIGSTATTAYYSSSGEAQGLFNGIIPDPGETIILWEYVREHWVEIDRKS